MRVDRIGLWSDGASTHHAGRHFSTSRGSPAATACTAGSGCHANGLSIGCCFPSDLEGRALTSAQLIDCPAVFRRGATCFRSVCSVFSSAARRAARFGLRFRDAALSHAHRLPLDGLDRSSKLPGIVSVSTGSYCLSLLRRLCRPTNCWNALVVQGDVQDCVESSRASARAQTGCRKCGFAQPR